MPTKFKGTKKERSALNAFITLARCNSSVVGSLSHDLATGGLTERQFAVLEALYHLGPMRQHELAEKMLCTAGNMTGVLSTLQGMKLITRDAESGDKRCRTVSLTAAGKKLIKNIFPDHVRRIVALFSSLSEREQHTLTQLCKKLGLSVKPQ